MILWLAIACSTSSGTQSSGPPPALVELGVARDGALSDTWTYLGDVQALEQAELAAGAAGAVRRVNVREGDTVATGDRLLEVDASVVGAELAQARGNRDRVKADLDQARRARDRLQRVDAGVVAANELDAANALVSSLEAQLASADGTVRLAGARLGRHRVTAPFAGVIARRHVDPGDWVNPGTPVLDLVSTGAVEIRVEAPVALTRRIQAGDPVELRGTTPLAGTVAGVVPTVDRVSRTAVVRVRPDDTAPWLVAGSAVPVAFQVLQDGGVVVPRDAVVTGPVDDKVFKVVEGAATPVVVVPMARSADEVLVAVEDEALKPGDRVVIRGNERLRPGQPVRVPE